VEVGKYKWVSTIHPYHTLNIPAKEETGKIILNFTLKHFNGGVIDYIKSSPIVRIGVDRSTEPAPEDIEPSVVDDIYYRLDSGGIGNDHDMLSETSRFKPNQHTIDSIIGLRSKIEPYTGQSEPESQEETWFKTVDGEILSE